MNTQFLFLETPLKHRFKWFLCAFLCMIASTYTQAQTQAEMSIDAINTYKIAEKNLNETYQQILYSYQKDIQFINNLKIAQRLWIKFRDAEIDALYPKRNAGYYGSMITICKYTSLTEITEERTQKLNRWLEGKNEGDCESSIKANE